MNFAFNHSISFAPDGSMIIQNGSQTIKMGQGGMVIQNNGGQNVYMNGNGVQFPPYQNQYTNYSGPGFSMQTSFSTGPAYYHQQQYYEDSGEEISSQNSSYEEQEHWHDNNVPQQHYSYQPTQPSNMNVGWQVHHTVNYPPTNVYYYTPVQEQNQPPPQPRPRCLTKEQLNMLPVNTYLTKPKAKTPSNKSNQSSKSKTKEKGNSKKDESSYVESCPICIVDYKTGDKVKTLPCLHRFHRECVDKWLLMKSDCPICKYDLLE